MTRIPIPKATHQGQMTVGPLDLDCYVLEDGGACFINAEWPAPLE